MVKRICIISTGNIIVNANQAILNLRKKNIFPGLISMHTIKPLDTELIK